MFAKFLSTISWNSKFFYTSISNFQRISWSKTYSYGTRKISL